MDLTAPWVKAVVHVSRGHSFSPAWLSCNIHLTICELWVQQNCDWQIKLIRKCVALQIQHFKSYTRTHKEKKQHQNHTFSTEMISADVRNNEQNAAQPFKRENKTYFCLLLMLSSVPCRLMATDALLLPPAPIDWFCSAVSQPRQTHGYQKKQPPKSLKHTTTTTTKNIKNKQPGHSVPTRNPSLLPSASRSIRKTFLEMSREKGRHFQSGKQPQSFNT